MVRCLAKAGLANVEASNKADLVRVIHRGYCSNSSTVYRGKDLILSFLTQIQRPLLWCPILVGTGRLSGSHLQYCTAPVGVFLELLRL